MEYLHPHVQLPQVRFHCSNHSREVSERTDEDSHAITGLKETFVEVGGWRLVGHFSILPRSNAQSAGYYGRPMMYLMP